MTDYASLHGVRVATTGEVYSSRAPIDTLGFSPSDRVVTSDIYSRLCYVYGLMILD